jgi:phosphoribosylamine-glycine ligase
VLGEAIDLVIADAAAIASGVADEVAAVNVPVLGSGRAAALVQSRCRQHVWLSENNLPVARGRAFDDAAKAESVAATMDLPVLVQADAPDGPSVLCRQRAELRTAIARCRDASPGGRTAPILVQEYHAGPLVTVSAFGVGDRFHPVPLARLHRIGAEPWSPIAGAHRATSVLWARLERRLHEAVRAPLIAAFRGAALPVSGWIGANCRLAPTGPIVESLRLVPEPLEAALLLPLFQGDLVPFLFAAGAGSDEPPGDWSWRPAAGVAVMLVAKTWPHGFSSGQTLDRLSDLDPGIFAFHNRTANPLGLVYTPKAERAIGRRGSVWQLVSERLAGGHGSFSPETVTTGGEILALVAHDPELAQARAKVHRAAQSLEIAGTIFLTGVGEREL